MRNLNVSESATANTARVFLPLLEQLQQLWAVSLQSCVPKPEFRDATAAVGHRMQGQMKDS